MAEPLVFRRVWGADGETARIERLTPWHPEIEITADFLEHADARFVAHGDGLVTFSCADEEATYGIYGDERDPAYPTTTVLRARLLRVRTTSGGACSSEAPGMGAALHDGGG
jgi:hypothetical protein